MSDRSQDIISVKLFFKTNVFDHNQSVLMFVIPFPPLSLCSPRPSIYGPSPPSLVPKAVYRRASMSIRPDDDNEDTVLFFSKIKWLESPCSGVFSSHSFV